MIVNEFNPIKMNKYLCFLDEIQTKMAGIDLFSKTNFWSYGGHYVLP